MTILTSPGNYSSVSNEMLFVVSETTKTADPVTYPNYKFVLDIYIDSVIIARLKANPDPINGFGVFDVSTILRDYVPSYGLKATYTNAVEEYDINVAYQVKVGEEYAYDLFTNIIEDVTDRTAYRVYVPRPLLSTDVITSKLQTFLSNMPAIRTEYKDAKWLIIPYFGNTSGETVTYNYDDGSNIVGASSGFNYEAYIGNVMQMSLGFDKLSTSLTTTQKNSVKRFVITSDTTNDTIYFNFECSKYTPITLAWLNPYGCYESQSFGYISKKSTSITKKEYGQLPYQIDASGVVSYDSNGVMYGSKKGYSNTVKTTLNLTSHILTDAEYEWLADMFNSPDVYMFDTVLDRFVPVTISDSNYEYRTYLNSKLSPLRFSVEFSDDYNSQYL